MAVTVTMPQLGESVSEGTVTRWLKQVGDTVTADEPLLEISTDKVDTEIPSPASGVLLSIAAAEDETVLVGGVLAVIGEPSEATAEPAAPAPAATPAPAPVATPAPAPTSEPLPAPTPEPPAVAAHAAPLESAAAAPTGTNVLLPALGESVT